MIMDTRRGGRTLTILSEEAEEKGEKLDKWGGGDHGTGLYSPERAQRKKQDTKGTFLQT